MAISNSEFSLTEETFTGFDKDTDPVLIQVYNFFEQVYKLLNNLELHAQIRVSNYSVQATIKATCAVNGEEYSAIQSSHMFDNYPNVFDWELEAEAVATQLVRQLSNDIFYHTDEYHAMCKRLSERFAKMTMEEEE